MKKSILIAAGTCMIAFGVNAQVKTSTNVGGFILKGGVNRANISVTDNGSVDESKTLTSFNVGFAVDLPIADGLSIQPGLLFTGKGAKTQQGKETDASYYRATTNPMYVELPVNLVGKIPLGGTTNLLIGAGPYAAMGVAGKNKSEGKVLFGGAFNSETDIKYSNDDPTTAQEENGGYGKLKRFDYGFNALGGIDFGKVQLTANYGYGLTKLNSGTNNRDNDNNKNRVVSLSLGLKL
jgi:hypothetical protein